MGERAIPRLELSQHRLANGLRVVLNPDPTTPLVAVNLWYHVGSRNERPGRTGLAHLFEHMLFQGSAHVGANDHFAHVQQVGGVANGSTWYDRTNYYETLPAHALDLGLWLESDRMGFLLPALTSEKLETQRQVVANERRQRVDNQPYGRAYERLHELLYPPDHPYHWPVIGYLEDIEAASLDDVADFFRTWYAPGNAVLTLAGDVEPATALAAVERWFGELDGGPAAPPAPRAEPASGGGTREVLPDDVELHRFYIGFSVPGYGSDDWLALDLLSTALAGGRSSPLYQDLVHGRQLAQDVAAFVLPSELCATFAVVATVRPDKEPQALEEAIWSHLAAAGAGALAEPDLERARNRTLTGMFDALQQLDQRADGLAQAATFLGDAGAALEVVGRALRLTADDLSAAAGRWLARPRSATVLVAPRSEAG